VVFALAENPPFSAFTTRPRFAPKLDLVLSTGITAAAILAGFAALFALLPRASRRDGQGRRRRRSGRRSLPALQPGEEAKQCPTCVEAVSAAAETCPFCGHKVAEPAAR
jgi:hypothetical protein